MLQLRNSTPFAATLMLLPDREGIDTLYAVVKGTFAIGAQGAAASVAEEQVPITLADEHHGEPASSSIKRPSDVGLGKPGTDVVLLGSAWAPAGRPVSHMDVWVAAGPVGKHLRVFGDRIWDTSAAGPVMTPPRPFARMPLVWERAFGGGDVTPEGPSLDQRNPVGVGYHDSRGSKQAAGSPVPNIEDPQSPLTDWNQAPIPAGVAPVSPHWEWRRRYAGTYDDAWQRRRAPYLPEDFDSRFFHVAAPGLATPVPLQGGEGVDLRGVTPSGILQFPLPAVQPVIAFRVDMATEERVGQMETLVLEPDAGRFELVWRAALRCDKKALRVREVAVMLGSL